MSFNIKENYVISGEVLNLLYELIETARDGKRSKSMYLIGILAGLIYGKNFDKVNNG